MSMLLPLSLLIILVMNVYDNCFLQRHLTTSIKQVNLSISPMLNLLEKRLKVLSSYYLLFIYPKSEGGQQFNESTHFIPCFAKL